MIKKKFTVIVLLFILVLSACSTTPEDLSVVPEGPTEEEFAEKREEMMLLLNSEEAQAKLNGIALVKGLGLENDPEVCEQLIGFLDDFQDDGEMTAFILSSFHDVPEDEDSKCEMALMDQFTYAGDQGLGKLESDIYQAILEKDFDENQEFYEAYLNRTLEESDAEKLNQFMVLSGKFASEAQLLEMTEPFKESSYFYFNDVTQETALNLYLQYLNRTTQGTLQSNPDHMDLFFADLYARRASNIIKEHEIPVHQNNIDNLGALLTDDVLMDIDYINSGSGGTCKTISTIDTILMIFDSGPSTPVCHWSMAYLESLEGNEVARLEYGNCKDDMEETILKAFSHLEHCEFQERSDAYYDFIIKSTESGSLKVNKMLIEQLVKMDRKDAAVAISDYIKNWVNADWAFEVYGMMFYQLMDLDPQVGIETALYYMTYQEPGLSADTVFYLSDDITDFVIEMIREEQIALDQQLVDTFIEASKVNEAATYRILKVFKELNFDETQIVPSLEELLETEDPLDRFIAARLLSSEYDAGLELFKPYFDNRQLEIIAGAYEVSAKYSDKDLIVEAIETYGDLQMASYFLNDHGDKLYQASKAWGEAHGYRVEVIILD